MFVHKLHNKNLRRPVPQHFNDLATKIIHYVKQVRMFYGPGRVCATVVTAGYYNSCVQSLYANFWTRKGP